MALSAAVSVAPMVWGAPPRLAQSVAVVRLVGELLWRWRSRAARDMPRRRPELALTEGDCSIGRPPGRCSLAASAPSVLWLESHSLELLSTASQGSRAPSTASLGRCRAAAGVFRTAAPQRRAYSREELAWRQRLRDPSVQCSDSLQRAGRRRDRRSAHALDNCRSSSLQPTAPAREGFLSDLRRNRERDSHDRP